MIRELLTREDFLKGVRDGVSIVITDTARAARFHPSAQSCDHVTLDGFYQKVILNKRQHGRYFAVGSRSEAEQRWASLSDCWGWT